jgi:beta-mannosidase
MNRTFSLSQGWILKPLPETQLPEEIRFPSEGIPAAVPGTVHTDLLNAGLIPDPFYADNELRLQWIHEGIPNHL